MVIIKTIFPAPSCSNTQSSPEFPLERDFCRILKALDFQGIRFLQGAMEQLKGVI
jgi:hypothetical protein